MRAPDEHQELRGEGVAELVRQKIDLGWFFLHASPDLFAGKFSVVCSISLKPTRMIARVCINCNVLL